jgi:hypothetical protein
MSQLASDNFQRANEKPLSDGGNWTTPAWEFDNDIQVVSDRATYSNPPGFSDALWTGASPSSWPNDQYAEVTFGEANDSDTTSGPIVRLSSVNAYFAVVASPSIIINKGGTVDGYTALGSVAASVAQGDVLKLVASGTTIKAYKNATEVVSVTDSTYSSGNPGFIISNNHSAAATLTNWAAGNLTQSAPTLSPTPGSYTTAQTVTLSAPGSDAIYYTTDGSTPTTSSNLYTGPITVSVTETIKAIAFTVGLPNSSVASGTYTIAVTPAPTGISPTTGEQGTTISNFTVNGSGFGTAGTLSFTGTGIMVNSYSTQTDSQIVASITLSASAAVGASNVTVTNATSSLTGTLSGAFTVTSGLVGCFEMIPPTFPTAPKSQIFPKPTFAGKLLGLRPGYGKRR